MDAGIVEAPGDITEENKFKGHPEPVDPSSTWL